MHAASCCPFLAPRRDGRAGRPSLGFRPLRPVLRRLSSLVRRDTDSDAQVVTLPAGPHLIQYAGTRHGRRAVIVLRAEPRFKAISKCASSRESRLPSSPEPRAASGRRLRSSSAQPGIGLGLIARRRAELECNGRRKSSPPAETAVAAVADVGDRRALRSAIASVEDRSSDRSTSWSQTPDSERPPGSTR